MRNETLCCVYQGPTGLVSRDLDIIFGLSPLANFILKNPVVTRAPNRHTKCSFLHRLAFVRVF